MKRKILAIMLGFVLMLGMFTGCTVKDENPNEQYADRDIKLTMYYYNAGYGGEHYEAMAADYMENFDSEVYIDMVPKNDSPTMRTQITTNDCDADIVQLSVDMFGQTASIENLSDLYEMYPLGEEGQTKIKDKNAELYEYYKEAYGENKSQTGYFRLASGGNGGGYTFAYNKTTLDSIFGVDKYVLPVTSQELFAFGDDIRGKGHYLMSTALGDTGGDYTVYLQQLWLAQLMGKEKYDHYYSAEYYDGSTWKFSWEEPTMMTNAQEEIKDTYTQLHELFIGENKYLHPEVKSLDHLFNNQVFSGAGYGNYEEKTAFLYIGSWLENEMKNVKGANQNQTYGAIRTPVNSKIVNYLSVQIDDATLAAIIRAIDAGSDYATVKANVAGASEITEADFAKIYEARKMIVTIRCSEIVVPKLSSQEAWKKEHIYKFLRYLTSDRANVVAANTKGGLNMTAYGAPVKDSDLTVTRTLFIQNMVDIAKDAVVIDTAQVNKISKKVLPLSTVYVPGSENLAKYLFDRKDAEAQTADEMYTQLYSAATASNLWKNKVELYKTEMGIVD